MTQLRGFSDLFDDEENRLGGALPGTMAHLRQVEREKRLRENGTKSERSQPTPGHDGTVTKSAAGKSAIPGLPSEPGESAAKESLDKRLAMHRLMEKGFSEADALVRVFPGDRKRRRRLNTWKALGLWPIPASELACGDTSQSPPAAETAGPAHQSHPAPMWSRDLEARVEAIVRKVCGEMVDNLRHTLEEAAGANDRESPPAPVLNGTDQDATSGLERKRLTITIDKVLAEKFREEIKRKNLSGSRLADTILWHWYARPPLSYM